jgi:hypothetical protein
MLQFSTSKAAQPEQQATHERMRSAVLQAKRRQQTLQVEWKLEKERLNGQCTYMCATGTSLVINLAAA